MAAPRAAPFLLRPAAISALLLLFCSAALLRPATAQLPYPLQGSALPAPTNSGLAGGSGNAGGGKVDVNVTALLERVYAMGADTSTYSAMWWLVLTWRDPDAGAAVSRRTAQVLSGADSCNKTCDYSGLATAGCCDTIWLPHIELLNIVTYDDSQLPRYRISANATSGTVTWSTRLVGTWYAPFDFRAYPFEHQHLLLELSIASYQAPAAGLVWEHVAKLNNTAHTKGADLAGWYVNWGKGKVYDSRGCQKDAGVAEPSYALAPFASSSGAPGAPPPPPAADAASYSSVTTGDRYVPPNPGRGTTTPGWCGTYAGAPHHLYDEARALYGPIVLVADIMIKRVSSYYVLTNLIPVLLITLVAFVVFFMPQDALGDRMSVVLTMFLSLTAMQFVFDFPPANYINALQIVVLVSYIMISIACIESLVVNRIATVNRVVSNKRTCMRKYGQMLAKGGIARDAKFGGGGKTHNAIAGGGGAVGGGRTTGRHLGGGNGGLMGGGMRRAPSVRGPADGPGGGAPPDVECGRADSALEVQQQTAQHLAFSPYASMAARGLPRPGGRAGASATPRGRLTPAGAPLRSPSNGLHHANSSAAGSASEREDAFPEPPAGPIPALAAEPTAAATVAAGAAFAGGASFAASPFASARNQPSFAAGSDAGGGGGGGGGAGDDRRSDTGSTTMSSTTTGKGGLASWRRRCAAACCGGGGIGGLLASLRALGAALAAWLVAAAHAPRQFYQQCKEDRAFAEFIAARIDKWACIICAVAYVVVISVMLWYEVQVGDHRLMMGDRPGNM